MRLHAVLMGQRLQGAGSVPAAGLHLHLRGDFRRERTLTGGCRGRATLSGHGVRVHATLAHQGLQHGRINLAGSRIDALRCGALRPLSLRQYVDGASRGHDIHRVLRLLHLLRVLDGLERLLERLNALLELFGLLVQQVGDRLIGLHEVVLASSGMKVSCDSRRPCRSIGDEGCGQVVRAAGEHAIHGAAGGNGLRLWSAGIDWGAPAAISPAL